LCFFASSSSAAMISGRCAPSFSPSTPFAAPHWTHARAASGVSTGPLPQATPARWKLTMRGATISLRLLRSRSLTVRALFVSGTPTTVVMPCASQSL
jgi:hypothetical protein